MQLLGVDCDRCMREPTAEQLRSLYRLCHLLTNVMFHPIHIVRLDERTLNLFILAGQSEEIELEIQPDGSIEP
ncbi:hypothetical protein [Microcoleus sp. CAWBG556]|uniref:DUF6888 family protein n=2 Tax=Microcoleus TaxID=44471 RepID=UPI00345C981A